MPFVDGDRNQIQDVIPTGTESPVFPAHILAIMNAVEPRLVLRVPTIAQAGTEPDSVLPYENGMILTTTTSPYEVYRYTNNAWVKIWPNIYSGTAVPANTLGVNGDIYIQY